MRSFLLVVNRVIVGFESTVCFMIIGDYISRKIFVDTFYNGEMDNGMKIIKFRDLKMYIYEFMIRNTDFYY